MDDEPSGNDGFVGRSQASETSGRRAAGAQATGQPPSVFPPIVISTQLNPHRRTSSQPLVRATRRPLTSIEGTGASRGSVRCPAAQELQSNVPDVPEPPLSHSRMSGPDQWLPSLRGRVTVPSANAVAAAASCTAVALPVGSCTGAWYCT